LKVRASIDTRHYIDIIKGYFHKAIKSKRQTLEKVPLFKNDITTTKAASQNEIQVSHDQRDARYVGYLKFYRWK
jgi:hypothetical protein